MNMALLPSVSSARVPGNYEAAKQALAACQSIDECKDWADKAAAMASYAKQAQDETLLKMAHRIKARAVRRGGELYRQIESAQGQRNDLQLDTVDHTKSRTDLARSAGLSKHQQDQANRIANIPEADFDVQVESDDPPTLSELAAQGTKKRRKPVDLKGRDPKAFNRALHFLGTFESYARDLERVDVGSAVADLIDAERLALRAFINRIDAVHDRIMTRI